MNQRDWRPFNIAVWVEIILAYIMPFRKLVNTVFCEKVMITSMHS